MLTDEELQAHCYSCHDFSNSQTALMKGRCPWKTLTEFAYLVALTDLKINNNPKPNKKPKPTKPKPKPKWNPGISFKSKSVLYIPMLHILLYRFLIKSTQAQMLLAYTHAIPIYLGGFLIKSVWMKNLLFHIQRVSNCCELRLSFPLTYVQTSSQLRTKLFT